MRLHTKFYDNKCVNELVQGLSDRRNNKQTIMMKLHIILDVPLVTTLHYLTIFVNMVEMCHIRYTVLCGLGKGKVNRKSNWTKLHF